MRCGLICYACVWLRDGTSGLRVHVTLAAAKSQASSSRGVATMLTSGLRVHVKQAAAKSQAGSSRGVACTLPLEPQWGV